MLSPYRIVFCRGYGIGPEREGAGLHPEEGTAFNVIHSFRTSQNWLRRH